MFQLGKRAKKFRRMEELGGGKIVQGQLSIFPANYLAVPLLDMPTLAAQYISAMESGESRDWCRCTWAVHPEDEHLDTNQCRRCERYIKDKAHGGLPEDFDTGESHRFQGRRLRKIEAAPDCPVHTREGLLLYFLQWVMDNSQ